MKRIGILLILLFCLGATPKNIVTELPSSYALNICPTISVKMRCPYCDEVYMEEKPDHNTMNCQVVTISMLAPMHPRMRFRLPDGTVYETCETTYLRALVRLTGAKKVEEETP